MTLIERAAETILAALLADFQARGLTSRDLSGGYVGIPISQLRQACSHYPPVDFDLAFDGLEATAIGTGPMAAWDNEPHSGVVILGMYSKREYAYLKEAGYRRAQALKSPPETQASVQITGNTFYQSPIAIGESVSQALTIDASDDAQVIETLANLLHNEGLEGQVDELRSLIASTREGQVTLARTIFQKVFGVASEGARQIAWNVISALIALQLTLPN